MSEAEHRAALEVIFRAFFHSCIPPVDSSERYPLPRIHPAALELAIRDVQMVFAQQPAQGRR